VLNYLSVFRGALQLSSQVGNAGNTITLDTLQSNPEKNYLRKNSPLREVQKIDSDGMVIIDVNSSFEHLITKIRLYEKFHHFPGISARKKREVARLYHCLTKELLIEYGVNWNKINGGKDSIIRRITDPHLYNKKSNGESENSRVVESKLLERIV
jgi:hypothetical protein